MNLHKYVFIQYKYTNSNKLCMPLFLLTTQGKIFNVELGIEYNSDIFFHKIDGNLCLSVDGNLYYITKGNLLQIKNPFNKPIDNFSTYACTLIVKIGDSYHRGVLCNNCCDTIDDKYYSRALCSDLCNAINNSSLLIESNVKDIIYMSHTIIYYVDNNHNVFEYDKFSKRKTKIFSNAEHIVKNRGSRVYVLTTKNNRYNGIMIDNGCEKAEIVNYSMCIFEYKYIIMFNGELYKSMSIMINTTNMKQTIPNIDHNIDAVKIVSCIDNRYYCEDNNNVIIYSSNNTMRIYENCVATNIKYRFMKTKSANIQ
jgi:hypothetical protein